MVVEVGVRRIEICSPIFQQRSEPMQVFLIDPGEQRINAVEIDDGLQGIRRLIGFDSVDADEIDSNGDRLYFDESCFIRQQPDARRFKLDNLAPVAGRGVVVGGDAGGTALRDPVVTIEALTPRVRFL
jgi:hypothetical protein